MAGIRISVMGASGSGTSTVGRALAAALSLPHFDSDDYFHGPGDPPFQNPRSATERYELICRDLAVDHSWVLSGGLVDWSPRPRLDFTCIVFLYVPPSLRIERLRRRERERFGRRILKGGDMYAAHQEFIDWASRYDSGDIQGKTQAMHEAWLQEQTGPVLEFRGEPSVSDITAQVLRFVPDSEQID